MRHTPWCPGPDAADLLAKKIKSGEQVKARLKKCWKRRTIKKVSLGDRQAAHSVQGRNTGGQDSLRLRLWHEVYALLLINSSNELIQRAGFAVLGKSMHFNAPPPSLYLRPPLHAPNSGGRKRHLITVLPRFKTPREELTSTMDHLSCGGTHAAGRPSTSSTSLVCRCACCDPVTHAPPVSRSRQRWVTARWHRAIYASRRERVMNESWG